MLDNLILDTDSYKSSHFLQLPPGTKKLFGYLESRGGRYKDTLFFGLQPILRRLAQGVSANQISRAEAFMKAHGEPFPSEGWYHIANELDGKIPLRIKAVPEGTIVPVRNALMTVETTDEKVPWIMGWFETMLMRLWYPITVATRSLASKRVIFEHLKATSDDPLGELPFKLHDFGSRGVSSFESAGIGGAAHLVNFKGTDTIAGALYAAEHYTDLDFEHPLGFSIPAMEHSTVTAWGEKGEADAFRNMLRSNRDAKLIACVSDSYDIYRAVEEIWADELLEEVKASGKTIVIRPDSGDPAEVNVNILKILERKLGMRTNGKGFKVLPPYFRIIQGDGNDSEADIEKVLLALRQHGYSASNIAFGMGGGLLQKLDRDTQKFAFKASAINVNGDWRDIKKNPKTDLGKASKGGVLDLIWAGDEYITMTCPPSNLDGAMDLLHHHGSALETVFEKGIVRRNEKFDVIRKRAGKEFA